MTSRNLRIPAAINDEFDQRIRANGLAPGAALAVALVDLLTLSDDELVAKVATQEATQKRASRLARQAGE